MKELLTKAGFGDTEKEADDDTPHEGELADVEMATETIEDTPPSNRDPPDEGEIAVEASDEVIDAALEGQAGQEIIEATPPSAGGATVEEPVQLESEEQEVFFCCY